MKSYLKEPPTKEEKPLPGIYRWRDNSNGELIVLFTAPEEGVILKAEVAEKREGRYETHLRDYKDADWEYFTGQLTLEN